MNRLLCSLVCLSGVLWLTPVCVRAQETAGDLGKQAEDLRAQMTQVERGLSAVRQRLGLTDRGLFKDEEYAKLTEASMAANKALEAKASEILKADAEGAQLLQQREALNAKIAELGGRSRERKTERQ